jgi:putative colanic acid biosynthesis UDP-glucose lipid carrier transferase
MPDATLPAPTQERFAALDIDPATWRPLAGHPGQQPLSLAEASPRAKRCFDIAAASALLVFLAPLLLAIAVLVRLDTPGPALFLQRRTGCRGSFRIAKFRTMHAHLTDEAARFQTRRGDQRVTPIGGFLRRTSLDELPQLFNVLAGDMSIVGPRPHAPATSVADRELEDIDPRYPLRHLVRPGITGLAQVSACRGELDSEAKLRRRVDLDLAYIEQRSMALDLRIIWLTVRILLRDPGAY